MIGRTPSRLVTRSTCVLFLGLICCSVEVTRFLAPRVLMQRRVAHPTGQESRGNQLKALTGLSHGKS